MASCVLSLRPAASSSLPLRGKSSALTQRQPRLWSSLSPQRRAVKVGLKDFKKWEVEYRSKLAKILLSGAIAIGVSLSGVNYADAKVGVNKPELLPKEYTPVIDVAGFLSPGQENRLVEEITGLEKDTGYKLRILIQNFPDTPVIDNVRDNLVEILNVKGTLNGLAIKDFWSVDDRTIVFVADPTFGNILHFNVGATVDLEVPRSFWSRVAGKYGNVFYWKEKGEDRSIEDAVEAISTCLRDPLGSNGCSEVL